MAKVYRKTYAINQDILQLIKIQKTVPPAFSDIFIKDVTNGYMQTSTVKIPAENKQNQKYGYLAVFDDEKWGL